MAALHEGAFGAPGAALRGEGSAPPLPRLTLIGQRINAAARADVRQALQAGDYAALAGLMRAQCAAGARHIDLCAAAPGVDEAAALRRLMDLLAETCPQAVPVPDSPSADVLERALRGWHGEVVINSTTAAPDRLNRMLALAGEHGARLIALAMFDRPGGPDERRRALDAIVRRADALGFARAWLIADCLALAGSPACATLEALDHARGLGLDTVLGISNVSHGLPGRGALNAALLAMATARGLNWAILDPLDDGIMDAVCALDLLTGHDELGLGYVRRMKQRAGREEDRPKE